MPHHFHARGETASVARLALADLHVRRVDWPGPGDTP